MAQNNIKLNTTIDFLNQKDFIFYTRFDKKNDFVFNGKNDEKFKYIKQNDRFVALNNPIEYFFNEDGFRGKNFKDINTNDSIAAGCSYTFGLGLPENLTWPSLLKNYFYNSNVYNIGFMGFTTSIIINNIFVFIKKYGIPKNILIILPPIHRKIQFNKKIKIIESIHDPLLFFNENDWHKNFNDETHMFSSLSNNVMLLNILENFCNINNINLLWFSWDIYSQKIYEKIDFKFLIKEDSFYKIDNNIDIPINFDKRYLNSADDGYHPGVKDQFCFAKTFLNNLYDLEIYDNTRN